MSLWDFGGRELVLRSFRIINNKFDQGVNACHRLPA